MRSAALLVALASALAAAGCSFSGSSAKQQADSGAASASGSLCPKAWRPSWQKLANQIKAPVYCPTWMPSPLDAKIGGQWSDIDSVDKTSRSYLVSFIYHESQTGDVHVNLRGYPGRQKVPSCRETEFVNGKQRRLTLPCFADPQGHVRAGGIDATLYTVNQDADQWHVLYLWRAHGGIYAVSQHVTAPLTYRQVSVSLKRVLSGLVEVDPS